MTAQYERRDILKLSALTVSSVAGCVSAPEADENTPTPTATAPPTEPAEQAQGARQRFPDYKWGLLENATPTVDTTIKMTKGLRFRPTIAKVPPETTVTWVNTSSFKHTLVIPALDVDRSVSGNSQTQMTVSQTGTFDYVCDIHPPTMLGRLIVSTGVELPTPTTTPTSTASSTSTETPTEIPRAKGAITIEGSEWKLVPAKFRTEKGRKLTVTFKNVGTIAHNLTIGKYPVEKRAADKQAKSSEFMAQTKTIQPGKTASVTVSPAPAGTYPYWCDVSGHRQAGMHGRMIVA